MPTQPPLGEGAVGLGEAGRGAHDAVLETRGLEVAGAAQRREHVLGEARGLGQDRLDGVRGGLGEALGFGQATGAEHGVEQEAHLGHRRAIGHGPLPAGRHSSFRRGPDAAIRGPPPRDPRPAAAARQAERGVRRPARGER